MTTEDVQAKLADFEGKMQRAIAFREQAREQVRQAEVGVHQLEGAVAVLRELLTPPQPTAGNGLDQTATALAAE